MPLEIGENAPSMSVVTDDGSLLDLSTLYAKGLVLVYFYPKADTPGCTVQACNLRDNITGLNKAGVTVIGVSADSVDAQAKFKKKYNLNFVLVADSERALIKAFGVDARQTFIVKDGKVAWRQLKATPKTQAADALAALKGL
jgi:peroxiredoxin Q/BCP